MSLKFNFTGNLKFNSLDSKLPWLQEGVSKSGNDYRTLNLAVNADTNRAMTKLYSQKRDVIKATDSDKNEISVDWDDRLDKDVIKSFPSWRKFVIANGDDRKEFIAEADVIDYVSEHLEDLKNGRYTVTGNMKRSEYKGKFYDGFEIQNIYKVKDEDGDTAKKRKSELRITGVIYLNKDSFDTELWKSEKRLKIRAFTSEYNNDLKKNQFVPIELIFDCGKVDFENEKHRKLVNFKLKNIGAQLTDDNKIKPIIKSKYVSMNIALKYINGAEEVEFDESQLTETQKEAIELGLKTLDDFKPHGKIFGDNIVEYRFININLLGDYKNGYVEYPESTEEFESNIWAINEEEEVDLDEAAEEESEAKEEKPEETDDEDDEDLFD